MRKTCGTGRIIPMILSNKIARIHVLRIGILNCLNQILCICFCVCVCVCVRFMCEIYFDICMVGGRTGVT